jgi:hypothetical protein
MTGSRRLTVNGTSSVAVVYRAGSAGVNVTDNVCAPAFSTVPSAGVYSNVPATVVEAFSCASPSAVPYVIAEGRGQPTIGVARRTVIVVVLLAVA